MQNLTMSLKEKEYDGTCDAEGSESDYREGHVSQLRFLSGKKQKKDFEEVVNAPLNLIHLFHKIMKRMTFGNSYNRMGKVICPHQLLLHRLELDLNLDRY
ncbi:hypothetical protein GIB67_025873 [Kingdonia uniflora]|uniref:Uncharacterized protein n=1 Tax=Kingdonia uniflora TaxID=39325 RepID=A0A7J7MDA3_9MAGN|nr:hypothetical protein GIB67_025873 [Kingdonia uniflora]